MGRLLEKYPERIRIGVDDDGEYVWDREIQPKEQGFTFLWDVATHTFSAYRFIVIKNYVDELDDQTRKQEIIEEYMAWGERNGFVVCQNAQEELSRLILKYGETVQFTPEQRHRNRLEQLGMEYRGTQKVTGERLRRVTHCYNCESHLDNSIDVECKACGWILCTCGACGCGYSK